MVNLAVTTSYLNGYIRVEAINHRDGTFTIKVLPKDGEPLYEYEYEDEDSFNTDLQMIKTRFNIVSTYIEELDSK